MLIFKKKQFRLRLIGAALPVFLVVITLALLPKIFGGKSQETIAGRPEVKGSSDENYEYDFEGGSFKLFLGALAGNPAMMVKQGSRELQLTLFKGSLSNLENAGSEGTMQEESGAGVTPNPSSSGKSINATPEEYVSSTPSPTPVPTQPPSQNLKLPEGLEK